MIKFIDTYSDIVEKNYPEWDMPNKESEHFKSLYEIADVIDNILVPEIHKQEKAVAASVNVYSALKSKRYFSQGSMSELLAVDLRHALDMELTLKWTTPWAEMKIAANAASTPPPFLEMPPIISDIESKFSPFITSHYSDFKQIEVVITAIDKIISAAYQEYSKTQSKPYLPL